jgi:hypothetical protein
MPPNPSLLILLVIAIASCSIVGAANNEKIGKPHSTVLQLTSNNFDDYIQDPANGLWLLDFYAPWSVVRYLQHAFRSAQWQILFTLSSSNFYTGAVIAKSLLRCWMPLLLF